MNYDEFLSSTPRQLMGLNDLNIRYEENILFNVIAKVYGGNDDVDYVENDRGIDKVQSFSDLFV
jgi:hypothetical protein